MKRILLSVLLLNLHTATATDDATVLTRQELLDLLPGTQAEYLTKGGSLHRWKNEQDGTFVASTDNKKYGSALGTQSVTAAGTWRVDDRGKYCVSIEWKREPESWCARILRTADGAYYLNTVDPARKIELHR